MPALLALLLLIGGGAVAGAENSLPGDLLYPVKINFNEQVRSLLAVTDESEARWQVTAAERRLSEAEELARDGRLTGEIRSELELEFAANIMEAESRTEGLITSGELAVASDITVTLESVLIAHQKIITDLASLTQSTVDAANIAIDAGGGDGEIENSQLTVHADSLGLVLDELAKLGETVGEKLESVSIVREAVDVQLLSAADREDEAKALSLNREKSAETKLIAVRARLTEHKSLHGKDASLDAEAQLLAAENALDRGRAAIGEKDFKNAYRRYQEAVNLSLQSDSFVRADSSARAQKKKEKNVKVDEEMSPATEVSAPDGAEALDVLRDIAQPMGITTGEGEADTAESLDAEPTSPDPIP